MKRRFYLLLGTVLLLLSSCQLAGLPAAQAAPTKGSRPAPSQGLATPTLPKQAQPNSSQPIQPQPIPTFARDLSATQPPQPNQPAEQIYLPKISSGQGDPANDSPATPTVVPARPGDIPRLPAYSPHTGSNLEPARWKEWPVLPAISQRAKDIYKLGLDRGNDPRRFSKIGDCQSIRQYFLGLFDDVDQGLRLGGDLPKYSGVLDNFKGSYTRVSMSVRTGFNVASVLAPLNSDPNQCNAGETPLECESRLWNPSIALISMETWTQDRPTQAFEGYLRQIVDFMLSRSVVPILATKADNLEGDHSINAMIARVAYEYDIPLWNFWASADPLPGHGLMDDGFHLTNGPSIMTNPDNLKLAWNVRNLTALQAMDLVWRTVAGKK